MEPLEARNLLAAGDLDASFGAGGRVTTDLVSTSAALDDNARGVAIQADGKIVVAGHARDADFAVVRYNADGTLDSSFGSGGKAVTDFGGDDEGYDVAIAPTGKIIVVGNAGNDFAVARYTAAGVLDTTFGGTGKVVTNLGAQDGAVGVALDASGRIVVVGFSDQGSGRGLDLAVTRYLASGALDPAFGVGGKVLTHLSATEALLDVAIDSQGRIVAAGYSIRSGGTDYDFTLVRYLPSGELDASLSGDGIQTTNFNATPGFDVARSVAIDGQGRILLGGDASMTNIDMAAARYLDNGNLDTSFSGDGKATIDFGSGSDRGYYGSAVDAAGNVVLAGYIDGGASGWDFGLVRLESDGDLDSSFGVGGKVKTDFGASASDFGLNMAIAPDGKIVVVGQSFVGGLRGYDFAVARYESALPTGEIRGVKWNDQNGDGVRQESEPGLAGWTVFLDQNRNRVLDSGELTAVTGGDGSYAFTGLTPGNYFVTEVQQPGWAPTFPQSLADGVRVFVSGGTHIIDKNRGKILRTNFHGGDATIIHSDVYAPIGIDDRTGLLYFRESSAAGTTVRTDLGAANPEVFLTGWGPNMYEFDSANNRFFFPIGRDLYKASLDSPSPATIMPGLNGISDIEYDPLTDAVITANTNALTTGDNVWSFPADGPNGTQIISPLDEILGLAVDRVNRRIYFTDTLLSGGFARLIYVADLDGSNVRRHIDTAIFGLSRPTDIEVVPELNALFWIDSYLDGLYRANLDGTGAARIADLSFDPEQLDVYVPFVATPVGSGQTVQNVNFGNRQVSFDFGDAAGSSFSQSAPVTLATNGARHLARGPQLGPARDSEADGAPSTGADSDDLNASPDDEDGVSFAGPLAASTLAARSGAVTIDLVNPDPTANYLSAWIDWNRNGDWRDSGDQVLASYDLGTSSGPRQVSFTIPQDSGANVVPGLAYARFRLSSEPIPKLYGAARDGEVEDLLVAITNEIPDIRLLAMEASGGTALTVTYEIVDGPAEPFELAFLQSADAAYGGDTTLASVTVSSAADLSSGQHTLSLTIGGGGGQIPLPGAGAAESEGDYYLLAVADPSDAVFEADDHFASEDNTAVFAGIYHAPGAAVLVHGGDTADTGSFAAGTLNLTFNGQLYSYASADVSSLRFRLHGGNDALSGPTLKKSVWLHGGEGNDTLTGGAGPDMLAGGPGDDTLKGGGENDLFIFAADSPLGSDLLSDSGGVDTLDFSSTLSTGVTLHLGLTSLQTVNSNFSLKLSSATAFENLTGGRQGDSLTGSTQNNVLIGGEGDDLLVGGKGNDSYRFDADGPLGHDTINEAGGGVDTLDFASTSSRNVSLNLSLTSLQQVNDHLELTFLQGDKLENVIGGDGDDTLLGNGLANAFTGRAGDDLLAGAGGGDRYLFAADSPLGVDQIDEQPGAGVDTLDFSATTTQAILVDLALTDEQIVCSNLRLILSSGAAIENATGGAKNDTLYGNSLANALVGGKGADRLEAREGADTLTGGAGGDLLIGGDGDDTYQFDADSQLGADTVDESPAAAGADLLNFSATTSRAVSVNLAVASAQVVNSNLTLTLLSGEAIEYVVGGSLADTLRGNSLDNLLIGGKGNDQLFGAGGRDLLVGGSGADSLSGESADDILLGGKLSYSNESTLAFDRAAFQALLAEWTRGDVGYADRVSRLLSGGGLNDPYRINSSTVTADASAVDTLLGGDDLDWFVASAEDSTADDAAPEIVTTL